MNKIYRLIWNEVTRTWVAVSEVTRGRGKRTSAVTGLLAGALAMDAQRKFTPIRGLCLALALAGIGTAYAGPLPGQLPTGGQLAAGAASIARNGATLNIKQSSNSAIINWQSFSIGSAATVNFNQPSAASVTLNRVQNSNPSQIFGQLNANGQVFIQNPNGVLFGVGAQVNVGGLVATTLSLSDADFMAGKNRFANDGAAAAVINQGTLTAAEGGYIALLAPNVSNQGVIAATRGTALLAAGDQVTLNLDHGSLIAYRIDQGSIDALAENRQLIQADGGQVFMTAQAASALTTAVVNNTGVIEARTVQNVAGTIRLMGDMQSGTVNVGGTLDASAPDGGNGGFIETSASHVRVADTAHITTAAAAGLKGTWLIDPVDFTIAATGGDISGAQLGTDLAVTDVTIQTGTGSVVCVGSASCGAGTSGVGDINVNDTVTWSAHTLTLSAWNNININSALNGSGTAGLALQYGQATTDGHIISGYARYNVGAPVNLASTGSFSTQLGSTGTVIDYTIITSLGTEADARTTGLHTLQGMANASTGHYVLGSDIDAGVTSNWNSDGAYNPTYAGFTPIGSSQFVGIFDGLGHTISNLKINRASDNVGLFGRVAGGSVIQNLTLDAAYISSSGNNVGALVGMNYGSIDHEAVTGSIITGDHNVGGLVGWNYGSISHAVVSFVPGLDAYSTPIHIGAVSGSNYVGGLVGANGGQGQVGNIIGSSATVAVTTTGYTGSGFGGLVGINGIRSNIDSSFATGSVTESYADGVGGLVGSNYGSISNSHATGDINGSRDVGGLVGLNFGSISNLA